MICLWCGRPILGYRRDEIRTEPSRSQTCSDRCERHWDRAAKSRVGDPGTTP